MTLRDARGRRRLAAWSQTDVLGLSRICAVPTVTRSATSAMPDRLCDVATENAAAPSRSPPRVRWASYRRAFSSATDACPASTSRRRRSSASNWSKPSFEMTMTPVTREPYMSGTARSDSSISAVPAICSPNSWFAASPTRSGSPVSATRPVMPRPTRRREELDRRPRARAAISVAAERDRQRGRPRRGGRHDSCGSR